MSPVMTNTVPSSSTCSVRDRVLIMASANIWAAASPATAATRDRQCSRTSAGSSSEGSGGVVVTARSCQMSLAGRDCLDLHQLLGGGQERHHQGGDGRLRLRH